MQSAGFGRRAAALAIDSVVSVVVAYAFTFPSAPRLWSSGVLLLSYVFFTGFFSQTPGMRLLGIACVRYGTGGSLGVPRAIVRAVLLQLIVPALILNAEGRGWHDRAAGSITVRVG